VTNTIGTKNVIRLRERPKFRIIFFRSPEVYDDHANSVPRRLLKACRFSVASNDIVLRARGRPKACSFAT